MTELGDVFGSLKAMSLLQLLLSFLACIGYALAQGRLVGPRARRYAWALAALGAFGFAFESPDWMRAAMLIAFAVAGLGVFAALAWVTSRMLGEAHSPAAQAPADPVPQPNAARARPPRPTEHAHSI
ncbi:MAG: hypothetical protein KGK18_21815 [Burkholderiales bacterium]|nr:hypothetical protein [Burkholderiales bacterium]